MRTELKSRFELVVGLGVATILALLLFVSAAASANGGAELSCGDPKAPNGPNTIVRTGSVLDVVGNNLGNTIEILAGGDVDLITDFAPDYSLIGITRLRIWTCMGDDSVNLDSEYRLLGPNHVSTGSGNDMVWGSSARDVIRGGNESDVLHGNDGDDNIDGGFGDDMLFGNGGNDVVQGGPGNDELSGGSGDDRLNGEKGDDVLGGGPDRDKLYGSSGDAYLVDSPDGNGRVGLMNCGSGLDTYVDFGSELIKVKKCEIDDSP